MADIIISSGDLAKLLGKDRSEIESQFLVDGASKPTSETGTLLKTLVSDKVKTNVDRERDRLDPGGVRNRARKEVLKEVNDALSAKGAEGENWKDQIESLTKPATAPKEITEADVRGHTFFKTTVDKLKGDLQAEKDAHVATQRSYTIKQEDADVYKFVKSYISDEKNNFVLPKNETLLNKRIQNLVNEVRSGDRKIVQKDGKLVAVDKDGRQLEDDSFNSYTAASFLDEVTKGYFERQVAQPRTPANITTPPAGGGGAKVFPVMKSEGDLQVAMDKILEKGGSSADMKAEMEALSDYFETVVRPTLS